MLRNRRKTQIATTAVENEIDRRGFLQVGGLQIGGIASLGISLPQVLAEQSASRKQARDINCIFMFLQGGASHIDMYDMKPNMPSEVRGEYVPISTRLPDMQLCHQLPRLSACSDKFSLIRSMHSYTSKHGEGDVHIMSGSPVDKNLQAPGFGAVMSWQQQPLAPVPPFVHFGDMKHPSYSAPGYSGYLGHTYDPFLVKQNPNAGDFAIEEFKTTDTVDVGRLQGRKALFKALDRYQADRERQLEFARVHDAFYEQAFALTHSRRAKQAFDLSQEPARLRNEYGRNRVGQGMLMARRLVEAGVRFVTVQGYVDTKIYGWDHHWGIFPHLNQQLPIYDQAYAALLNDLDDRGLLENTLVITAGEFGRTPRINNNKRGPGRDHWGRCFSLTMGGGGIQTGRVIGASDKWGGGVQDRPVSVADFSATVYHVLGLDPHAEKNVDGRRVKVLPTGRVVRELL